MMWLQLLFAGSSGLVLHQGIGGALIIGFLAAAYFSPILKKDFVYAAIIVAVALGFEILGSHDEAKHVQAQEQVINQDVDKAVQHSVTPKVRKAKDPWNRKEY